MIITIEKDIPLPRGAAGCGRPRIYPLNEMQVGDSFLVPVNDPAKRKDRQNYLAAAARNGGEKTGAKFATRQVPEGVRVWRVS